MKPLPLKPSELCRRCSPESLPFQTTGELTPLEEPLGQERALEALRFAAAMRGEGYNVYAMGPVGVGKHTTVRELLEKRAAGEPVPSDWCYVNDFSDSQKPRALRLPAGRGREFQSDLSKLIEELQVAIPAAFESEDYRIRVQGLEKQMDEKRRTLMADLQKRATEHSLTVVRTPVGLAVAPISKGEVIDPDQFRQLPDEERDRLQGQIRELQQQVQEALRTVAQLEREQREKVKQMNSEVAGFAVGHLFDELRNRYKDLPDALAHVDAVQEEVINNVQDFLGHADGEDVAAQFRKLFAEGPEFWRYGANLLVDNADQKGAPVVYLDLPTQPNLVGRIEHHSHFGMLVTDFTLIRSGALQRANGGYLIVDAARVLSQPFAWEELKRSLRSKEVKIEPMERLYGLGTPSLEPEPIPLDIKVVLVGDRLLYHLLAEYDPEFLPLFKVTADFEEVFTRDPAGELAFARLVATQIKRQSLRPFEREAVAEVIEQCARRAADAERLDGRLSLLTDLLREADHFAAAAGTEVVARAEVRQALDAQERRLDRVRRRLLEEVGRGILLIDTRGERVGQVNGLSVISLGQYAFGHPSRITASVRLGRGEVVDIEREVELGGPIHSKGVLILSGYLGARYAGERPFSLSASLVFEQSYSGVEGDSASSAELYALLSALAEAPIKQSLAVTGSVNQHGQIQPVGGVNEKIEGFFEVCRARGLTGAEGVLVPKSNLPHLMLKREVVEAAQAGMFHVYPVETVDQGIELLTGIPAGTRDDKGKYAPDSINGRVQARLERLAEQAKAFGAPAPAPGAPVPAGASR